MKPAATTPPLAEGVVLSPNGSALAKAFVSARRHLGDMTFAVGGMTGAALRRRARAEVAEVAEWAEWTEWTKNPGPASWIVTGHQAEMIHAGVWFKDAAAAALAEAVGGSALHVVADLDERPGGWLAVASFDADGRLGWTAAPYTDRPGPHCGAHRPPPSAAMFEALADTLAGAAGAGDALGSWLTAAREARPHARTLAEWLTVGRAAIDESVGIRVSNVQLSQLVRRSAWMHFAADLALRFEQMHALHAEVLTAYRAAHGITDRHRPVNDLGDWAGALELPLWVYRKTGRRQAVYARRRRGGVELLTAGGAIGHLDGQAEAAATQLAELASGGTILAPRALTLTLFLRTFVADLFVHGTGGALYDRLGDTLTERWFNWRPPPFVTATATLRLYLERFDVTAADLAAARWNVHHARHNPHLYVPADKLTGPVAAMVQDRAAVLAEIADAPRFSEDRAAAFTRLHKINDRLGQRLPEVEAQTQAALRQIGERLAHNAIADSREAFVALMPTAKLARLVEQARRWAAAIGPRRTKASNHRLTSPRRVSEVFATGVRAGDGRMLLLGLPGSPGPSRAAFAVGKRHGNAVRRNRVRRQCRAAYRQVLDELPDGWDLVIVPRPAKRHSVVDLTRSMTALARRLATKHKAHKHG